MDAIPETGGEINLSTHHLNSNLYFTVQDNGIGMNEETREN
jgi:signal transduction histidine kinase